MTNENTTTKNIGLTKVQIKAIKKSTRMSACSNNWDNKTSGSLTFEANVTVEGAKYSRSEYISELDVKVHGLDYDDKLEDCSAGSISQENLALIQKLVKEGDILELSFRRLASITGNREGFDRRIGKRWDIDQFSLIIKRGEEETEIILKVIAARPDQYGHMISLKKPEPAPEAEAREDKEQEAA